MMSDRDAFLSAIRKEPWNDLPRLVFADWLEEAGDPRGELIRIQCQLHHWVPDLDLREELQQQERELLRENYDEWLAPFDDIRGAFAQMDRGLFDLLLTQIPEEIPHPEWIQTLRFRSIPFEYKHLYDFLNLNTFTSLTTVDFARMSLTNPLLMVLQQLIQREQFSSLRLANCIDFRQVVPFVLQLPDSFPHLCLDGCATIAQLREHLNTAGQFSEESRWFQSLLNYGPVPSEDALLNSIEMPFKRIPHGRFRMGTNRNSGSVLYGDEVEHLVTITKDFYLGVYPVRQREFQRVMGENRSRFQYTPAYQEHPVENVNWFSAVQFCERLSALPEEIQAGRRYRLPTEAEWEYACRAGSPLHFVWGNHWSNEYGNSKQVRTSTTPVGQFLPNRFGLFDLLGNVREWCSDWYDREYYAESPEKDPKGPILAEQKVLRGGSWDVTDEENCRPAYRVYLPRDRSLPGVGFRVVCEIEPREL